VPDVLAGVVVWLNKVVGRPPSPQVIKSPKAAKAAHYRQPQSFGDMVLTDRGLTTEIAQFQLGDLVFIHIFVGMLFEFLGVLYN
jgi:hypothetical protein